MGWKSALALMGYAVSVGLLVADRGLSLGYLGRLAIVVCVFSAVIHILDRCRRDRAALVQKIDDSVGAVWDAGARHERRLVDLEMEAPTMELAAVHDLVPRR
jgi:hypothetical protein